MVRFRVCQPEGDGRRTASASLPPNLPCEDVRIEGGFTLIEVLVVVGVIGLVAAISIPSLVRARIAANEGSAIASLRVISSAQATYYAHGGVGGYATALADLGQPCPGSSEPFISPDLALDPSVKSGYRFVLRAAAAGQPGRNDCHGTPVLSDFYSTATPLTYGVTGLRAFASNNAGSIYFDPAGVPPTEAAIAPNGGGQLIQ